MPKIVKHLLAGFPTGASHFNGGEVVFQMGDFIFKWGVLPIGGHQF